MVPLQFRTLRPQIPERHAPLMSPLVFLAIPVIVFVVGSTMLWAGSRWRRGDDFGRHAVPDDLRTIAPMVRDQRQAGWQSGAGAPVGDRGIRS